MLAPPTRLLSAAMWCVMQRRNALHYGKLEEFVTSISEAVPGLLSDRHRAKLTLGLRARLILELCRGPDPPDSSLILPHLRRLRPPVGNRDQKVQAASWAFQRQVRNLLDSPAERRRFFQEEVFVGQYGPQFDCALEKLLWEFLSRLDQLLPMPDLAQTVSWLSAAPCVLEDLEQPELLNTLRQHHHLLGHLNTAPSLPPSTGDSILSSLSLPPSGRVWSTKSIGQSGATPDSVSPASLTHPANGRRGCSSPIRPVIGLIASQDAPLTRGRKGAEPARDTPVREAESGAHAYTLRLRSRDGAGARQEGAGLMDGKGGASDERLKRRKQQEEEEEGKAGMGGGEKWAGLRKSERIRTRCRSEEGAELSLVMSCLQTQPRVRLERLALPAPPPRRHDAAVRSPRRPLPGPTEAALPRMGAEPGKRKRKFSSTDTPEKHLPITSEKENCVSPLMWGASPVLTLRTKSRGKDSPYPDCNDDVIIDSEDEEMKHVKGRLFVKRYHKTKNNTFVPTFREFWGPSLA
ncbi:TERF1-interacting nuclear factor 2 isoform X2 [Conger conger]|nr:TERF1-interacting nuclear factor 2 isoform X2 [Conger conger]